MQAGSFENKSLSKSETFQQTSNGGSRHGSKPPEGPAIISLKYISASAKEALTILESAAGLIPVPLLQDRVGHLMVVIMAHVTSNSAEGDMEIVIRAAHGMEKGVGDLLK